MSALVRWHLGAGDALLCCGLVRALVHKGARLILPCWERNRPSIEILFADLIKREQVTLFSVTTDDYASPCVNEIRLGYYGEGFDATRFDWSFYNQAGVAFLDKWEMFEVGGAFPKAPFNKHPERFVHDDYARGFNIPLDGLRPTGYPTIFDYTHLLREAREIHCINSSFAIYVDLMGLKKPLYLHRYARPDGGSMPVLGRNWKVLDQPL